MQKPDEKAKAIRSAFQARPSVHRSNDGVAPDGATPEGAGQSGASSAPRPTFRAPSIALPRSGGALRSLGEKFETNAFNGTATITIPIALPPGRDQLGPGISLSYNSGAGNG